MAGGAGRAHAPPLNPFLPIGGVAAPAPPPRRVLRLRPALQRLSRGGSSAPRRRKRGRYGPCDARAAPPGRLAAAPARTGPGQRERSAGAECGSWAQPLCQRPPAPGLLTKAGHGRNKPSRLSKSFPAQSRAEGGSRKEKMSNKRTKLLLGGDEPALPAQALVLKSNSRRPPSVLKRGQWGPILIPRKNRFRSSE